MHHDRPGRVLALLAGTIGVLALAIGVGAAVGPGPMAGAGLPAPASTAAPMPVQPGSLRVDELRVIRLSPDAMSLLVHTNQPSQIRLTYRADGSEPRTVSTDTETAHRLSLTDLRPGMRYEYRAQPVDPGTGAVGVAETAWFRTPEPGKRACAFGVIGDTHADSTAVIQQLIRLDLDFLLTTGDNVEMNVSGLTPEGAAEVWRHYFNQLMPISSRVPVYITLGNHDLSVNHQSVALAAFYSEVAPYLPSPSTMYSFDCGDAHFTVLDTETDNNAIHEIQRNWLGSDLRQTKKPLKIIVSHRPVIGTDENRTLYFPDGRVLGGGGWGFVGGSSWNFRGMLAGWGVAASFSGHRHVYNRYIKDGIVYFINPSASVGQALSANPPSSGDFEFAYPNVGGDAGTIAYALAKTGFLYGRVAEGAMTITALDADGNVMDIYPVRGRP